MPAKAKGSKKGGKGKGKGKKIVEDYQTIQDMWVASEKDDTEGLTKYLEQPPPDRKWDFLQSAGECLPRACERGHVESARLLLDAGCEVGIMGGKALHKAACHRHLNVLQLLYERQIDLNIRGIFTEYTAMHHACHYGNFQVVKFLVKNGAQVDILTHDENCGVNNGWAPIHFAADEGHLDLITYLIENGKATVDLPTAMGETALAIAAEHGRFDVVKYLVSAGADLHAVRRGLNVVQWCIYRANPDTTQFLVSYGARPELGVKCIWFKTQDDDLQSIIKREFSEAIFEKIDIAIYRGSVKLRERAAHMRILSDIDWEVKGVADQYATEGAQDELRCFPKHVVHLISSYEL